MKPAAAIAIILLTLTLALPAAAAGSKTIPVTSSADDAWILDGPPNYSTDSVIAIQEEFGILAYRVPLDLPKDATITAAYLQLTVAANSTQCYSPASYEPGSGNTQWAGITLEAIDDAQNYSTGPLITDRDYIAPSVAVTIPAMSAGMSWTSPNLASQLQQIIERPGWQPGNYVAASIGICNNSNELIQFHAYDGNPTAAPRLIIEYTYPTRIYMITLPSGALGIVEMRASFGELAVIVAALALALLTLWAQLRQAAWLISKRSGK